MTKIFKILNGSQDSELTMGNIDRQINEHYEYKQSQENDTKIRKSIPPGSLVIYKGSMSVSLTRIFVDFIFNTPLAVKLFHWMNTTFVAEEHFFATLIHNNYFYTDGYPGILKSIIINNNHYFKNDKIQERVCGIMKPMET